MFNFAVALLMLFPGFGTVISSTICYPPIAPAFITQNTTTGNTTATIAGTAGDSISVAIADNSQSVATVTTDSSGNFSLQVTLSSGANSFSATASNSCGSATSQTPLIITSTATTTQPTSSSGGGGSTTTTTTASGTSGGSTSSGSSSGGMSDHATTPVQSTGSDQSSSAAATTTTLGPDEGSIAPSSLLIDNVPNAAYTATGQRTTLAAVYLKGDASPGAAITIRDNGQIVATLTAAPNGTYGVSVPLAKGKNLIVVQATVNGNLVSQTITYVRTATLLHTRAGQVSVAVVLVALVILGYFIVGLRRKRKRNQS